MSVEWARVEVEAFTQDEQIALAYYDNGIPSLNPHPRFNVLTSRHRWGDHGETPDRACPVCKRKALAKAKEGAKP